ncbi:MAG: hypothetical protein WAL02_02800, partial [Rhodoplanes sp.]
ARNGVGRRERKGSGNRRSGGYCSQRLFHSSPKLDGATVALRLTEKSDLQASNTQVELHA